MTFVFVLRSLLACCHPREAQIGKRKLGLIFPIYTPVGALEANNIYKPVFTVTEKVLEEVPISEQEKEEKEKLQKQRLAAEKASANNKVRDFLN